MIVVNPSDVAQLQSIDFPSFFQLQKLVISGTIQSGLGILLFIGALLWLIISIIGGIYIIIKYDADLHSVFWYWINSNIVFWGINTLFSLPAIVGIFLWPLFLALTIILFIIWARRAGIMVPLLGALGLIGWAYGSAFGYESDGFLS